MAGNPKRRAKAKEKNPNYGTRWCDRPGFVGMKKTNLNTPGGKDVVPPVYFMSTPDGYYTIKEEVYCWRFALHGRARLACREAYGRDARRAGQRGPSPKLRARINVLLEQQQLGEIDLAKGPWAHYGWEEEFPNARWKHNPEDVYGNL